MVRIDDSPHRTEATVWNCTRFHSGEMLNEPRENINKFRVDCNRMLWCDRLALAHGLLLPIRSNMQICWTSPTPTLASASTPSSPQFHRGENTLSIRALTRSNRQTILISFSDCDKWIAVNYFVIKYLNRNRISHSATNLPRKRAPCCAATTNDGEWRTWNEMWFVFSVRFCWIVFHRLAKAEREFEIVSFRFFSVCFGFRFQFVGFETVCLS